MKNIFFAIIFLCFCSTPFTTYAGNESQQHGTGVTVTRHRIDRNSVCLLYKNGKVAVMHKGGQDVTMWLSVPLPTVFVVGGRMQSQDPKYGQFTLQLACYKGTAEELNAGFAARVMQRPICMTAPITYKYGPYVAEDRYDFGSYNDPCSMER